MTGKPSWMPLGKQGMIDIKRLDINYAQHFKYFLMSNRLKKTKREYSVVLFSSRPGCHHEFLEKPKGENVPSIRFLKWKVSAFINHLNILYVHQIQVYLKYA